MDVRLPDGTMIQNVPDDITRADLTAKLKANGYDVSKLEAEPVPTYGDRMGKIGISGARGLLLGGPLGLAVGAGGEGLRQSTEMLDRAAYGLGGKVTDLAAPHMPPEVAAGLGTAANVGVQALPMLAGGEIAKVASPAFQAGATKLMQSALKPSYKDLASGKAQKAITTMLDEGVSVTRGGVQKLRDQIDQINDSITAKLKDNPATIEAYKVVRGRLDELQERVLKQVNPQADAEVVQKAMNEFLNHPFLKQFGELPVKLAQEMKQGTYRAVGGKSYGELKGADIEAQKTLARGLKEEIADAVPGIAGLNAKESELLNALEQVQKRALMEGNKNAGGLAWLSKNPEAWAAFMADKSSAFKSIIARMMNAGSEQIPSTAGKAVGAAAGAYSGRKE